MKVRDVMNSEVLTVNSRVPIAEFDRLLIQHRVSGFPVVDGEKLVGLISRSDVVRALAIEHSYEEQVADYYSAILPRTGSHLAEDLRSMGARVGARIEGMTVGDVMVKSVFAADPDQSIVEAAKLLVEHGIHRLPVTEDGKLVGLLTTLDLVRLIAEGRA